MEVSHIPALVAWQGAEEKMGTFVGAHDCWLREWREAPRLIPDKRDGVERPA
jgi:hypothetical protein